MAAPGRKKGPAPKPRRAPEPKPAAPAPRPSGQADQAEPPPVPRNALGVFAAGVGVLAVLASLTITLGVVLGIVALVVGFLGHRRVRAGQATNRRSALAGMVLGVVALAVAGGVLTYGYYVLQQPAGKRFTACVDRAGDDRAAKDVCRDTFKRER